MIGTTRDEGNYFLPWISFATREEFAKRLEDYCGREADKILALYPGITKAELRRAASQYVTDAWFTQPARQLLRGMSTVTSPAFQYQFTHASRRLPALGSPHAIELRYVFNTLVDSNDEEDQQLAATMLRYWIQFARTGNPNAPSLPAWPEYQVGSERYLEIGDEIKPSAKLRAQACDVLDRVMTR
jgi:para-nitrobenzyl esterase